MTVTQFITQSNVQSASAALFRTDRSAALAVARLALGLVLLPHGAQKALGWFGGAGFSGTMEGLTSMGLPAVIAFLVIFIEFIGAIALIAGAAGRLVALGVGAVMVGAIAIAHGQFGFFMNWYGNQKGEGFEYHLLVIGLAAAVFIGGSGAWSVDRLLLRGRRA